MFHGLHYVRQAIAALAGCTGRGGSASERAALEEAFLRLRPAMMFEGTWPAELQAAADRVEAAFFRHGPPGETVRRMTDHEVRATLALMRAFADDAERIADEEPVPRTWQPRETPFAKRPRGRSAAEAGGR